MAASVFRCPRQTRPRLANHANRVESAIDLLGEQVGYAIDLLGEQVGYAIDLLGEQVGYAIHLLGNRSVTRSTTV